MRTRTREDILERMIAQLVARTELTDIRETDPGVQALGAVAPEIEAAHREAWRARDSGTVEGAQDEFVDELLGEVLPEGIGREQGSFAVGGAVVFTRPAGGGALVVQAGATVLRSKDGFVYRSMTASTFGAGALESSPVSVVASVKGSAGNCVEGEINRIGGNIPGVTGCRNTASISNGTDRQSDEQAKDMMRRALKGFAPATPAGILKAVLAIEDPTYGRVRFASWAPRNPVSPNQRTLYIDDGMGTSGPTVQVVDEVMLATSGGGELYLYTRHWPLQSAPTVLKDEADANLSVRWIYPSGQAFLSGGALAAGKTVTCPSYFYYTGLVGVAQRVVSGVASDYANFPGNDGAGDVISVRPARLMTNTYSTIEFDTTYATNVDPAVVGAAIRRRVAQMVNSRGIGVKLDIASIIATARVVPGVVNIQNVRINGVAYDANCLEDAVIRVRESDIETN